MRSLLISLGAALLSCSCSPATTKGMVEQNTAPEVVLNPYFSTTQDHVYKASIRYNEHPFGGLLIIKKQATGHRVVMTSELGNKLMDLSLTNGGMKKNSILEELDRRAFLHLLEKDLRLMLQEEHQVKAGFRRGNDRVFLSTAEGGKRYLFFAQDGYQPHRLIRRSFGKERVQVDIKARGPGIAEQILVQHLTRALTIELDRITEE